MDYFAQLCGTRIANFYLNGVFIFYFLITEKKFGLPSINGTKSSHITQASSTGPSPKSTAFRKKGKRRDFFQKVASIGRLQAWSGVDKKKPCKRNSATESLNVDEWHSHGIEARFSSTPRPAFDEIENHIKDPPRIQHLPSWRHYHRFSARCTFTWGLPVPMKMAPSLHSTSPHDSTWHYILCDV